MDATQENGFVNTLVEALAGQVAARVAEILRETKPTKMQPKYVTYESAGQLMDMPSETVRKLVQQGRLAASRDGGVVRIAVADIDSFMQRSRV